jgi:ribonuclease P protein component
VQHLLHKPQFDAVLGTRPVARTEHFFAHKLALSPENAALFSAEALQVGVMTPKRFAKRAVTRNLIKRQIYALCRELQLPPAACVVRLRATFSREQFKSASSDALKRAVRAELQVLLVALA